METFRKKVTLDTYVYYVPPSFTYSPATDGRVWSALSSHVVRDMKPARDQAILEGFDVLERVVVQLFLEHVGLPIILIEKVTEPVQTETRFKIDA